MSRTDDDLPSGVRGPDLDPAEFPSIEDFLLGYLHQDFEIEYGSADAAMDAFIADGGPEDHLLLAREWRTLRERMASLDDGHRLVALAALGAAWQPTSWQEVEDVFARVESVVEE